MWSTATTCQLGARPPRPSWYAERTNWSDELTDAVRAVRLPEAATERQAQTSTRIPSQFHHLFWNATPQDLTVAADGPYIAGRMLDAPDISAWRWALDTIQHGDIERALTRRGVQPSTRALVRNWGAHRRVHKVRFLSAAEQRLLDTPMSFGGIRVAGLPDLMATKLKLIQDRGALRDYFDIMIIETKANITVEEGLSLLIEKYRPKSPTGLIANVVRGLGYLGDVEDDPSLPEKRSIIEAYWQDRQPHLLRSLS